MAWTANIVLKSGNYITVENLTSIDVKSSPSSPIKKLQSFESFQLPKGQLSFILMKLNMFSSM